MVVGGGPQSGYGGANLGTGINVAYSIKIALQIFGTQDGEPTSATTSTCGVRLSLCSSEAKGVFKLHAQASKRNGHEITHFRSSCTACMFL